MRARENPVVISGDIEKAYLRIGLDISDRDVVRFIWVDDYRKGSKAETKIFRFARVPFGVISPFLLHMVLHSLLSAEKQNQHYALGRRSFYVDNLVTSVHTIGEALEVAESLTNRLKEVGMNLRDWCSNSREFEQAIPREI
jgi:hypothetical protein